MSKPNTHISNQQFLKALGLQGLLNTAYNGSTWLEDKSFAEKFNAAADAEVAEFLEEVTEKWKWYAKITKFDKQAALFEMIDVMHFMLAGFLYSFKEYGFSTLQENPSGVQLLTEQMNLQHAANRHHVFDEKFGFHHQMSYFYRRFWNQVTALKDIPCSAVKIQGLGCAAFDLINYIGVGAGFLGFTSEEVFEAYRLKNARNHERVKKGVMLGVDVKKDEEALCISTI